MPVPLSSLDKFLFFIFCLSIDRVPYFSFFTKTLISQIMQYSMAGTASVSNSLQIKSLKKPLHDPPVTF